MALNRIVVANKHILDGSNHLHHTSLSEISSEVESSWICEAVGSFFGASMVILYLSDAIRNNTDDDHAIEFFADKKSLESSSGTYLEIIKNSMKITGRIPDKEIISLLTPEIPAPLEQIDICPLFLEDESIGWIALGYDHTSPGNLTETELQKLERVIAEFTISILPRLSGSATTTSREVEYGVLEALKSNDELAFAVFSSNGDKITSNSRWTRFFDEKNEFISSATIAKKWGSEWNRALNGEMIKGRWISPLNESASLNWTMIPWRNKRNEVKGVIVLSDVLAKKTKNINEQKSHLLGKFINIENERKRLAKRLHDELAQSLSAALMNLELVDQSGDIQKQNAALLKARSLLNQTISEIRAISQQLRPSIIDDFGLVTALKVLCSNLSKTSGKEISFYAFQVDSDLPEFYQITVFRICQEALEYIMNYTHALVINVQLFQRETSVLLHIHDEDSADRSGKRGSIEKTGIEEYLIGIKEQTALHNGDFHLDLQTDNGTELIIQFPLNDYSKELQDTSYEKN